MHLGSNYFENSSGRTAWFCVVDPDAFAQLLFQDSGAMICEHQRDFDSPAGKGSGLEMAAAEA